ncbi:MAG: hypothetical protein AB7E04_10830 [Desulfobacteraceae bacterium]
MRILLENTIQGANRIWTSKVEPRQLLSLSKKPIHQQGSLSVLMVEDPTFDAPNNTLQFNIESVILLNLGNSSETIVVDSRENKSDAEPKKFTPTPPQNISSGDTNFLKELQKLPQIQQEIGEQILSGVRNEFTGELKYFPKSGKFVESPDNFWVIRIQPRAKNLRIIIYGEPYDHQNYKTIQLKRDMASYSSFVVGSNEQTQEAISAIKDAKRLKYTNR